MILMGKSICHIWVKSCLSGAPFPKNLQLDRQLASSILVSWRPPDNVNPADVRSYHVFLDGDFKTSVRGSDRTKALLENVESRKVQHGENRECYVYKNVMTIILHE